jgi:hypothetical protein
MFGVGGLEWRGQVGCRASGGSFVFNTKARVHLKSKGTAAFWLTVIGAACFHSCNKSYKAP